MHCVNALHQCIAVTRLIRPISGSRRRAGPVVASVNGDLTAAEPDLQRRSRLQLRREVKVVAACPLQAAVRDHQVQRPQDEECGNRSLIGRRTADAALTGGIGGTPARSKPLAIDAERNAPEGRQPSRPWTANPQESVC